MITIRAGDIEVEVEPDRGGRIGQITVSDTPLLVGREDAGGADLLWGAYPMVPWAGRIRGGRFEFRGDDYELPRNQGDHAMHGVGFVSTWMVEEAVDTRIRLSLAMPADRRWPFGGAVEQTFAVDSRGLTLEMRVSAADQAFPVSFGWHPWFRKPDQLEFRPEAMFRRDAEGVTVNELVEVPESPWDDCFVNREPVRLTIGSVDLELTADTEHWVVYDEPGHATCIEPQTGPPDAFNIAPQIVEPGESASLWARFGVLHRT